MRREEFTLRAPDGTGLFAQLWEPARGPEASLGIVHGLGEHCGRYGGVVERLVQAGVRVVTYDQRGHGRTGGPLPAFTTLVDDIDLLSAELQRSATGRRFLWGHSLGGALVLYASLFRRPSWHGVIASSPLLTPATRPPVYKLALAHLLARVWPSCTLRSGIDPCELSHDANVVRQYRGDPLIHDRVSAILGTTILRAGQQILAHADQLSVPLLLMHGTADRVTSFVSSRDFAARAGAVCTFLSWEGLLHELHFETAGDQVIRRMCDWMSSV